MKGQEKEGILMVDDVTKRFFGINECKSKGKLSYEHEDEFLSVT